METQLVVLGAGPGGYAAAFLAADLGISVTLLDREPRLGGTCLLRGCIPSKALLHVARAMADTRHLAEWGVNYPPPVFDLHVLRARKEKAIDTLAAGLKQLARRRKVRVVRARGTFADSQTLRIEPGGEEEPAGEEEPGDDRIRFEHCILATGSTPTTFSEFDPSSGRVMDSTAALELAEVPESLLIVGGGYIGLELGTVYAALGSRVSVVELTGGLLPGVDRNLVKPLLRKLRQEFQAVRLGTKLVSLTDRGDSVEATFEGAAGKTTGRFARVLVSVGRRPNTHALGLENTRVETDRRGFVRVDHRQRTTDEHILAVGDVTGGPMLAHRATRQGKVAAEVLAGQSALFEPKAIPAVIFTDPEIAYAGLSEDQAKLQGRDVKVVQFPWAASGRAHAVGRTEGMTKWLVDPQSDHVLGCGIVGPGAGELIGEAVLAIELGASIRDLAEAIHPHPTFSETLAAAAEVYLGTATDLYRPKRH